MLALFRTAQKQRTDVHAIGTKDVMMRRVVAAKTSGPMVRKARKGVGNIHFGGWEEG